MKLTVRPPYTLTKSGKVTGIIYLQSGDVAFPEAKWDDFIDTILGTWGDNLVKLLRKKSGKTQLFFFDGPYYILIIRYGSQFSAKLCEFGMPILDLKDFNFKEFLDSVVSAFDQLLAFENFETARPSDYASMLNAVQRLKQLAIE